ncbi:MAG: hypothetical protein ACRD6I_07060, partial [Candidatus Acidiferrales bacterium]
MLPMATQFHTARGRQKIQNLSVILLRAGSYVRTYTKSCMADGKRQANCVERISLAWGRLGATIKL